MRWCIWNGFTVIDIQHIPVESCLYYLEDVEVEKMQRGRSEEPSGVNSPLIDGPLAAKESWGFKRHHEETMDFLNSRVCHKARRPTYSFSSSFIFISWRLITLQYCSGFCHPLTWISHGFTCIHHPHPPSHLPLHPIPLRLPSAPGLSTCLMHPTWAGDLFHSR